MQATDKPIAGPQPHSYVLSLADGTRLALCAGDQAAAPVVDFLARVASLAPTPCPPASRTCAPWFGPCRPTCST